MSEAHHIAQAAASLGDRYADLRTFRNEPASVKARLDEIERSLKFDYDPEYRRELRREFLTLTEPEGLAR